MPLHRDIHWIGRQWAVTGHGMQLIDQKLQGFFDIEVSRLWDDDFVERIHAKDWLNVADFEKALAVARTRYAPLASKSVAPLAPVAKVEAAATSKPEQRDPVEPPRAVAELQAPAVATPVPVEPPTPPLTLFQMRYEGRARFVRPWRVVARKT